MAADMFRVVRTLGRSGPALASLPMSREAAMARFNEMVGCGLDRVRVIREADYQPALFGPQNQTGVYRGPYGVADWRQPLTDFERRAGVIEPAEKSAD
jgi:hypothetical protein